MICVEPKNDEELLKALKRSFSSRSFLPLLKEELKCKIQCRRLSEGEDEMKVQFQEKKEYQVYFYSFLRTFRFEFCINTQELPELPKKSVKIYTYVLNVYKNFNETQCIVAKQRIDLTTPRKFSTCYLFR